MSILAKCGEGGLFLARDMTLRCRPSEKETTDSQKWHPIVRLPAAGFSKYSLNACVPCTRDSADHGWLWIKVLGPFVTPAQACEKGRNISTFLPKKGNYMRGQRSIGPSLNSCHLLVFWFTALPLRYVLIEILMIIEALGPGSGPFLDSRTGLLKRWQNVLTSQNRQLD